MQFIGPIKNISHTQSEQANQKHLFYDHYKKR